MSESEEEYEVDKIVDDKLKTEKKCTSSDGKDSPRKSKTGLNGRFPAHEGLVCPPPRIK